MLGRIILLIALTASDVWAAAAPVRTDDGDTVTAYTDVSVPTTATLVKASNTSRAALNCTSSTAVRWGHSTVTATKGQQIAAGGSVTIHNTAAIYMIAETDTSTVSCTEETYSTSSSTGVFSP